MPYMYVTKLNEMETKLKRFLGYPGKDSSKLYFAWYIIAGLIKYISQYNKTIFNKLQK